MSHAQVKQARADTGRKMVRFFRMHPYVPDPERIRSAWVLFYSKLIAAARVNLDAGNIIADSAILAIDVILALLGSAIAWLSVITDVIAIGADVTELVKDDSILKGNQANAEAAHGWSSVLNVLSILAQAANILSLGVSFFTEGFKDLVKEGGKKLGVAIASRVAGTVGS